MRHEGREIQDGAGAGGARLLQDRLGRGDRRLELRHPDLVVARRLADHLLGEVEIGAGGDGDGVVLLGDLDQRDAGGRSVDLAHAGAVDVVVGEEGAQAVGEGIVADRADHRRRHAETSGCDGLVEAFAAGQERHGRAQYGFAGGRPARALHDDVHVEAAADDDANS